MPVYAILAINAIVFFPYGYDKLMARMGKRRIPEKILFGLAFLSGATGCAFGMILFNHKTSKPLFRYGVPLLLVAQLWVAWQWDLFSIILP